MSILIQLIFDKTWQHNILPRGIYEGITAWAQLFTKSNEDGVSKSSKNIPPTPLRSPRCGILKYSSHQRLNLG